MQGPPFQKEIRLPYAKWARHRADNGLIYLAHPGTGEVKWLWSRHHDPKTEHDYLVNTITGKRQWVTKENAHFCPVSAQPQSNASSKLNVSKDIKDTASALPNATENPKVLNGKHVRTSDDHFLPMPTAPARIATASMKEPSETADAKYREIAAPKSLGLTADEALMLVPETGRRYIFNRKTKTSHWLPDRPLDTISAEKRQKPLLGRSKPSRQPSSPLNDDIDIHPDLRKKTRVPSVGSRFHPTASAGGNGNMSAASHPSAQRPTMSARSPTLTAGPPKGPNQARPVPEAQATGPAGGDEVSRRLRSLNTILADVSKTTTSDKYNMARLRSLSIENPSKEEGQATSQRLLELEEYMTQQMLKVDAVESEGNQLIRAKRKETVKAILALTEEIERLRESLST